MGLVKRIFLFVGINILVVTTISALLAVLHVQPYLTEYGLSIPDLAVFCLIYGMAGSLISLALSRAIAKWVYGVKLINPSSCTAKEKWLVDTVNNLSRRSGLPAMPEVGIYQSDEANAFATGPTKSRALVAVSSGLFDLMSNDEIEGVIGHEISHVANGDMVTMTLVQGIINAFVIFASRVIAYVLTRNSKNNDGGYYLISMVLQTILLILAAIPIAYYSRARELKADDGGAKLAGREKMAEALEALQRTVDRVDSHAQPAAQAMKISSKPSGIWQLWSTHPPLEERIARLRNKRSAAEL